MLYQSHNKSILSKFNSRNYIFSQNTNSTFSLSKNFFPKLTLLIQTSNNRDHSILSCDRMARVLNQAHSQIPFNLIINIIEENKYLEGLKKSLSFSSYEVVKTQNFDDFLSLINNVDLTLLGDGGASHISALTNTPSLILFGKTSSTHWTPVWGG